MKSVKALSKAWTACINHPWQMLWAVLFDLTYGISFIGMLGYVWDQVVNGIEKLGSVMTGFENIVPEELVNPEVIAKLTEQQVLVQGVYSDIFQWVTIFVVAGYFIWVTFQGGSWWIAHEIVDKKFNRTQFVSRFLVITLVAEVLRVLLVSIISTITRYPLLGIIVIDQPIVTTVLGALQICLLYLAHVGYATIGNTPFWKPFTNAAWNKVGSVLTGYVIIACIVLTTLTLAAYLASLDLVLGFLITALVTAPAMTFCRVYAIGLVKQVRR